MTDHIQIDTANVLHNADTLRKDSVKAVREQINTIWHELDDAEKWSLAKLESLVADLKKHVGG